MSVFDQISKISVSCRPRVKVPQKTLDVYEKDKYYCCSSLKASLDEYLVYSGDIYTTPTNTGWSVLRSYSLHLNHITYLLSVSTMSTCFAKLSLYPTATSDKVYQLLVHGRWFSPGTPASSTTKTGRHDIAEILLKVALKHKRLKSNLYNLLWYHPKGFFVIIFRFFMTNL
jgi:hypothetical protein